MRSFMKHDLKKMLFDRNPDGSVTYSKEDMQVIAEEDRNEQTAFRNLVKQDYDVLMDAIRQKITGIAEFAYSKEFSAVRVSFEHNSGKSDCAEVSVSLWGEKLNSIQLYQEGDKIGNWTCSKAETHHFLFELPVSVEISRQAMQIEFGDAFVNCLEKQN